MNPNDLTLGLDFSADDLVDMVEMLMRPNVRGELSDDAEYRLQELLEYLK